MPTISSSDDDYSNHDSDFESISTCSVHEKKCNNELLSSNVNRTIQNQVGPTCQTPPKTHTNVSRNRIVTSTVQPENTRRHHATVSKYQNSNNNKFCRVFHSKGEEEESWRQFHIRQDKLVQLKRDKYEKMRREYEYKSLPNSCKLRCTKCGNMQTFPERMNDIMVCSLDGGHYKKLCTFNMKRFEERMVISKIKKEKVIRQIETERVMSLHSSAAKVIKRECKGDVFQRFLSRMEADLHARKERMKRLEQKYRGVKHITRPLDSKKYSIGVGDKCVGKSNAIQSKATIRKACSDKEYYDS